MEDKQLNRPSAEIDSDSPIPAFYQLKQHLLRQILSGDYRPGEQLPTEVELCARYGISRTPVNRALTELAAEGVIVRYRSRGTFVNPAWIRRNPGHAELRVLVPDGPWQDLVRDSAPPDLNIAVSVVPLRDLRRSLKIAVAEGNAPDVAVLDSIWVPEFADAGFLWALDDLNADWLARFQTDAHGAMRGANQHGGRTYAAAAEADVAGVWYRRDALEQAGVAVPTTWVELIDAAIAISEQGSLRYPIAMPGGRRAGETTTYCLLGLFASNNVAVLDAEAITLDTGRAVETLRLLRTFIDEHIMTPDVVTMTHSGPIRALADSNAAMSFGGSYEASTLATLSGTPLVDLTEEFAFTPIPGGPNGSPASLAGGMAYGVFRQAAYPALAMQLIERVTSSDALSAMYRATAQIPPLGAAQSSLATDPWLSRTTDMLKQAILRPATPFYASVSTQLQLMLEAVLTGRLGPAGAIENAATLISAITGLPIERNASRSRSWPTDGELSRLAP